MALVPASVPASDLESDEGLGQALDLASARVLVQKSYQVQRVVELALEWDQELARG